MKKKIRPMGQITQDIELLLEELVDLHELQVGEILYQIWAWLVIHRPDAIEEYVEDGSNPIFYRPKKRRSKNG
jgi:hypothetical protein